MTLTDKQKVQIYDLEQQIKTKLQTVSDAHKVFVTQEETIHIEIKILKDQIAMIENGA